MEQFYHVIASHDTFTFLAQYPFCCNSRTFVRSKNELKILVCGEKMTKMMYACSNFDPSLAFKLAPVCQEAREAEHARLLLVGQAQHRSSI